MSIRVALADSHVPYRSHLAAALAGQPDLEVVLQVPDGLAAVQALSCLHADTFPDVLLLDLDMPQQPGLAVLRSLAARYPALRVVATSLHEPAGLREAAVQAGAVAWYDKHAPLQELLAAIRGNPI